MTHVTMLEKHETLQAVFQFQGDVVVMCLVSHIFWEEPVILWLVGNHLMLGSMNALRVKKTRTENGQWDNSHKLNLTFI